MTQGLIISNTDRTHLPDFPTKCLPQKVVYVPGDESLYLRLMPGGQAPACNGTIDFAAACSSLDSASRFIYVFQIPDNADITGPLRVENLARIIYDDKEFDTALALDMGLGMPGNGHDWNTYQRLAEPFFRIMHHPLDNEDSYSLEQKMYGFTSLLISYKNWKKGDDERADAFMSIIAGGLVTRTGRRDDDEESMINGYWADVQDRLMDTKGRIVRYPVPIIGKTRTVTTLTKLVHLAGLFREMHGFTSNEAELLYTLIDTWREELPEGKVYNPNVLNLNSPNSLRESVVSAASLQGIPYLAYGMGKGRSGEEIRRAQSMNR